MRIAVVIDAGEQGPAADLVDALGTHAEVRALTFDPASETELGRTAAAISTLEAELAEARPTAVVAFGDGVAALAAALVAVKLGLHTARVGAGVRSGDRHEAAEINRIVADHLCDLLLCAGAGELDNLAREGLADKAEVVPDAQAGGPATADAIAAWADSYTSTA